MHNPFRQAARDYVAQHTGMPAEKFAVSLPPGHASGDYAVGCFPAAKELGKNPAQIAAEAAEAFTPRDGLASVVATGPFLNFTTDPAAVATRVLGDLEAAGDAFGNTDSGDGRTVCIDFSSPNIAKHLAFHHIRSTMLGNSLARLHRACGWKVVGINHLGDWGTTFGMLLVAWEKWGEGRDLSVDALNELYVRFRDEAKADDSLNDAARKRFAELEQGDAEARALWSKFREVSLAEFQEVYDLLGVSFDLVMGESEFEEFLEPTMQMLRSKSLVSESEGALVVDLSGDKMPPAILKKQDGATLYATRDVAAALWRYEHHNFDRSLYVVDKGQSLHFRQLIRVMEKAGFEFANHMQHVSFGQVRFGGRKTGTRTGNVIRLREVLDEAVAAIGERIAEKNPDLADHERVARQVGIGAIVFADLQTQREKDVEFDWDRMLSFEGDTGPYVQYAHARICSILRRAPGDLPEGDPALLVTAEEGAVLRALADLPDRIEKAVEDCEPSHITGWLLDLCGLFSRWYDQGNRDPGLKVLCEDRDTAAARIRLARAVRTALARGLYLVGLEAPEEM